MSTNEKTTISSGTGVNERLKTGTIMETAESMPELRAFMAAVRDANLVSELAAPDYKTLFAPTNDALESVAPEKVREAAPWHIAVGRQTEADLRTTSEVRTLAGPMPVQYEEGGTRFGGARIIRRDVPCVNGQIHILDRIARR